MSSPQLVLAIGITLASLCPCFTTPATGQNPSPGVQCRLEPAPDSPRAALTLPLIVIPRLAKVPAIDGTWGAEEWKDAEGTRAFVVPVAGKTAVPETRAWMGVDTQKLYLAVHCGLTPGAEPRAAATNHDGNVWEDDSIEVFVWPGRQCANFYQFIVNHQGVTFDAAYAVDPQTGKKDFSGRSQGTAWNPPYEKAIGRVKDGWILEMAIPLQEIGIRPEGVQSMRFNLWRNMVPGNTRYSSWATMSQTNAHIFPDYGFGICAFSFTKGQDFHLGGWKDWGHLGFLTLNGNLWTAISTQWDDIVFKVNLPDKAFADSPILLTPTVAPLLPGGTNGKPVALGEFRINSSMPMRLVIVGLEPGDYKLAMKVSGGNSLPEAGGIIMARKANLPQTIAGQVVFDDRDWRDTNAVAGAGGVETAMTPEVLLKTEFATPVLSFDPTEDETITCMTGFKGKLYVGSCTAPAITDTGSIFVYDQDLHLWKKAFQVNEQGLIRMEIYGDTMYIPGYDANDGGWDLGNIYLHDGVKWIERRTVPRAVHTYGLAVFKDRIYLSADIFDEAPPGVSLSDGQVPIYGRVVSSGDNGLTWREEYRGPTQGQDVGLLAVFKNQLVLNARGDLVVFDGQKWRSLNPYNASFMYVLDYAVDRDRMLLGTPFGLCYYNGERYWRSSLFSGGHIRGISRFGDYWILAGYSIRGAGISHGPTGTHHYPPVKEADPKAPKFWAYLTAVPREALDRDANGDLNWHKDGDKVQKEIKFIRTPEMPASCCEYRGRLYIGTHGDGRVLVLPVVKEGFLESAPRPIPKAGACRLYWETATPPGTSVRLQVRCAASKEALASSAYTGPDGTAQTFFDQSGTPFKVQQSGVLQYRAVLTTQDPAKTPYLKRVTVSEVE